MTSTDTEDSAREHASRLIKSLSETLGIRVPGVAVEYGRLEKSLAAHLGRVGPSNVDDLSSWILLECLEKHRGGTAVSWVDVLRAADRIRHRISRQHARERTLSTADIAVNATATNSSPAIDMTSLLKKLSQTDLVIFHSFFLDDERAADIAKRLGISLAQVYRRLSEIRDMLAHYLR
jgi:hypothetical protein